jgi:hypothetical protein
MSYPTTPVFSAVNLSSQNKTLISEAISGKIQARQIAGHKWTFTASYPPLTRAEFAPVSAFIMQQRGMLNTFDVEIPIVSDSLSVASGTFAVNGSRSAGDTSLAVDGLTGAIEAGDLIKFNGHTKVYMVVDKTDSLGNTVAITIEPPLVESVANNETIIYNNVPMRVRLANDVQEFGLRTDSLVTYEVDFIEVI